MTRQITPPLVASGLLAVLTLLLAGLGLASLNATAGKVNPLPITFNWTEDERARGILEASLTPVALADAEASVRRALAQSPYNNVARMRLVYILSLRAQGFPPGAQKLFQQSYDLAPYDPAVAEWRTTFALNHWEALPSSTQAAVRDEVRAFRSVTRPSIDMRRALRAVTTPEGRLVATLWLLRFYGSVS